MRLLINWRIAEITNNSCLRSILELIPASVINVPEYRFFTISIRSRESLIGDFLVSIVWFSYYCDLEVIFFNSGRPFSDWFYLIGVFRIGRTYFLGCDF